MRKLAFCWVNQSDVNIGCTTSAALCCGIQESVIYPTRVTRPGSLTQLIMDRSPTHHRQTTQRQTSIRGNFHASNPHISLILVSLHFLPVKSRIKFNLTVGASLYIKCLEVTVALIWHFINKTESHWINLQWPTKLTSMSLDCGGKLHSYHCANHCTYRYFQPKQQTDCPTDIPTYS